MVLYSLVRTTKLLPQLLHSKEMTQLGAFIILSEKGSEIFGAEYNRKPRRCIRKRRQ